MSAASFFDNDTQRDRTVLRDEPRAGLPPLDTVPDGCGTIAFFEAGDSSEARWIQASQDIVADLLEVR